MYLISNQQRREIMDYLTSFIELTADNGDNRVRDLKRRSGLLVKKLNIKEEIDYKLIKHKK